MFTYQDKSELLSRRNLYQGGGEIPNAMPLLVLCYVSLYVPNAGLLIAKGGQRPRILDDEKSYFLKIARTAHNLTSQQHVEFLFTRRRHILTTLCPFQKPKSMFTSDMRLAFCTCHLQVGPMQKYKLDSCKSFFTFNTYHLLHL